jgi:hypothetical protein
VEKYNGRYIHLTTFQKILFVFSGMLYSLIIFFVAQHKMGEINVSLDAFVFIGLLIGFIFASLAGLMCRGHAIKAYKYGRHEILSSLIESETINVGDFIPIQSLRGQVFCIKSVNQHCNIPELVMVRVFLFNTGEISTFFIWCGRDGELAQKLVKKLNPKNLPQIDQANLANSVEVVGKKYLRITYNEHEASPSFIEINIQNGKIVMSKL